MPVPHFGVVLTMADWQALAERVRAAGIAFGIAPHVRFAGQPGEQATMFFHDPSGNALEFKAFADLGQLVRDVSLADASKARRGWSTRSARSGASAGVTRHTLLPTSSATSNAPVRSITTPTGRPRASSSLSRKPVSTSTGLPAGRPLANGTKITL